MPVVRLPAFDPRSLLPSVAVLAGIVVVLAGIAAAQGLVATIAFGGLSAVICRRVQLGLQRRGMRGWAALTATFAAYVLVIAMLAVAVVASILALATEIGRESEALAARLRELADGFGLVTGVPADSVPRIDPGAVLEVIRSLLGAVSPAVTGLAMAILIAAYLLIDADSLRGRMLRATSPDVLARYDRLADELWTYVRVRAVLGGAAALADTVLLLVLGVPYAVLWGVVSFLFSFVPNIGFVLALVPPTLLAFLGGGLGPAVAVVVGYVAINLAFDYVLQPRMMASELDISPVVVITAILFWTLVIGPAGALLAVPLTIVLRTLLVPFPGARWFLAVLGPVPDDPPPTKAPAPPVAGDPAPDVAPPTIGP
jgi:AI-2 transport protein TqsA